jgi:hypothetical protein
MTLTNTNDITDWEITLLKRQKSYAVAALGDLKGKVRYYLTINLNLSSSSTALYYMFIKN